MVFFRLPQGKIFLATIDIVAPVSNTPRYSRPPSRIRTQNTKKLRVAIPSEGVQVAFCSELQKATFYKFPEFAFTFIISCMNC